MKAFLVVLAVLISLIHIQSCHNRNTDPGPLVSEDSLIVGYLDSMGITYQVDGDGIYSYPITLNPSGKRQDQGKILSVYFEISVLDGPLLQRYDSLDGLPVRLKQGVAAVYPLGVDKALAYMAEGEEWGFVIPSALAFSDYKSSLIPENATILFQATLMRIQNEDDIFLEDTMKIHDYVDSLNIMDTLFMPNGMLYKRLATGSGGIYPSTGNQTTITYTGYLPYKMDSPFDVSHASAASAFTYTFNASVVIDGLDVGVGQMQAGERSLMILPSALGYRESVRIFPIYDDLVADLIKNEVIPAYARKVGPYEVTIFDVRLLDVR